MKKVFVMAIIEFCQKDDEPDDAMLEIVKDSIETNVAPVHIIKKIKENEE